MFRGFFVDKTRVSLVENVNIMLDYLPIFSDTPPPKHWRYCIYEQRRKIQTLVLKNLEIPSQWPDM